MRNNAGGGEAAKKKDSLFLEKLEGRNGNEKEKKKSGFRKTNKQTSNLPIRTRIFRSWLELLDERNKKAGVRR